MSKERLVYIDALKGIGILLVIFSHSGAETGAMAYVGGVFIPLFFIVSGYTFHPKKLSFASQFKKRSLRLLKPYFFFSIVLLVLYQCFNLLDGVGVLYSRYCLYPLNSSNNIFLMSGGTPPLWFLTSMLTAFVPFYWLMRYPPQARWILLFFVVFTYVSQFLPVLLPWSLDTAGLHASFMFAGVLMAKEKLLLTQSSYLYIILSILYIVLCTINGELNVSVREYGLSFLLYFLSGVLGTIVLLWISKCIEDTYIGKGLASVGRHSLVIFSIQMFLLHRCHHVFHGMLHLPTEGLIFYAASVVKILVVIIVGCCISKLLNRYMPWLLK